MRLNPPTTDGPTPGTPASRLNLLLSYGGWRETPVVAQLPRLLEPLGITCHQAESGDDAARLIEQMLIHIAVVDLAIPLQRTGTAPGGSRILQLLRRLDQPPPTVVVRPPQAAPREHVRSLTEALRDGAFAVVDRPVALETMLEVLRRIVRRCYADNWPKS